MVTLLDYAALSAFIYNDQRGGGPQNTLNKVKLPPGWQDIDAVGFTGGTYLNSNPFSFTAGAYVNASGEIVISYKGTDFLTEFEGRSWNTAADLVADVGLALGKKAVGLWNLQQIAASTYFLAVKDWAAANGFNTNKISFTGHSLGGGLAANMAAWYGRTATTFAEAPFELSTINPAAIVTAAATLTAQAGVTVSAAVLEEINKLRDLLIPGEYERRQESVVNYHIGGEFLQYLRAALPTVVGTNRDNPIDIGDQALERAVSLHSMNLHLALLADDRLRVACTKISELVPTLLDTKLYAIDPNKPSKDFVTYLVADQLRGSMTRQDGLLGRFVTEIEKLDTSGGIAAQGEVRKGLIVAAMEYYYFNDPANATSFLTSSGNGIHFKYSDIRVPQIGLKSPRLLAEAIKPFLTTEEWSVVGHALATQDAWHIQTGAGGMSWTANTAAYDAAIGGAQTDNLDGAVGDDILIGGAGADFLTGGTGRDTLIGGVDLDWLDGGAGADSLMGGIGADIYHFATGWGNDTISDSDGKGIVQVDGIGNITGAGTKKTGANTWRTDDKRVTYALVDVSGNSKDLYISFSDRPDIITIKDWSTGKNLGIELSDTPAPSDIKVLTGGSDWEYAEADQALDGGGGTDVLFGSGGASKLVGGAGNDFLFASGAADTLEGGEGDDFLSGGSGHDLIIGGAGADLVLGISNAVNITRGPDDTRDWEDVIPGLRWEWGKGSTVSGSRLVYVDDDRLDARWVVKSGGVEAIVWVSGSAGNSDVSAGDTVFGGEGDDLIAGTGGGDVLSGDAGRDVLLGNGGDDAVYGGGDDDEMTGGDGDDYLDGGDGSDEMSGGYESDTLFGGEGGDRIFGDLPWVLGTKAPPTSENVARNGDDYIDGEGGADSLHGGGGNDVLLGGAGRDELHGEATDDDLNGGSDDDRLWGDDDINAKTDSATHGKDYLDGEDGADYLEGGGSDDNLFGGIGNDSLHGDSDANRASAGVKGKDYLDGEEGNDLLFGGGDQDTLFGGAGNDTLHGDYGDNSNVGTSDGGDYLDGEDGDDQLAGQGGADTLYGGDGNDTLLGDATQAESEGSNDGADYLDGGIGNDYLFGQGGSDTLSGGSGSDSLAGGGGDDQLDGGSGRDTLFGGDGADLLNGGSDNDYLDGGDSNDQLIGDAGDDTLYGKAGNDTLSGGDGTDILDGSLGNDQLDGGAGTDSLWGGAGIDMLVGGAEADYLDGGDGNDTLKGDDGNDSLLGGAGADQLEGATGNDTLFGADGNDSLSGGDGNDYLDGGVSDDQLLGGSGVDTLIGSDGNDALSGGDGNDALDGGIGNDQVNGDFGDDSLWGDAGADMLSGGAGADYVDGGDGKDTLLGGDGDDALLGGLDNDSLNGGAGDDDLAGGLGNDQLTGGAGDDGLWGDAGADLLLGGDGDDYLNGGDGDDTLDGGAGDDHYYGGTGNNTYALEADSGHDSVLSDDKASLSYNIQLGAGLNKGNVDYSRIGADLYLWLLAGETGTGEPGGSAIKVSDFFGIIEHYLQGLPNCDPRDLFIKYVGDDEKLNIEQLAARTSVTTLGDDLLVAYTTADRLYVPGAVLLGDEGNDILYGRDGADRLEGGIGSDTIRAGDAADTVLGGADNDQLMGEAGADYLDGGEGYDQLSGGAGNDTLVAGAARGAFGDFLEGDDGDDVYIFDRGFGSSHVNDFGTGGSSFDTLRFGAGISSSDLVLTRAVNDGLLISIKGTADSIEVVNQFYPRYPGSTIDRRIEQITFADGTTWDLATILAKAMAPTSGNDSIVGSELAGDSIDGGDGNDTLVGLGGADTLVGGTGSDRLSGDGDSEGGSPGADVLDGGAGDDFLEGGEGNDLLTGGSGIDSLFGGAGDDVLDGGAGDDLLCGDGGFDTYTFGIGSGRDVIHDASDGGPVGSAAGIVLIGAGLTPADVTMTRVGDDLVLSVSATSDQLTVQLYFAPGANFSTLNFKFASGTMWDLAAVQSHLTTVSIPAGRSINGTNTSESLVGGAGPDTLGGNGGNDTLAGGPGDDFLDGGAGSDAYLFGRGAGQDTISNLDTVAASLDEIRLGPGISASDVVLMRQGDALVLSIRDTADSLRVLSQFQSDYQVDRIVFSNGAAWDAGTIADLVLDGGEGVILSGGTAGDILTGGVGADRLVGATGNDTLHGGVGDDRLLGGDGGDELHGGAQHDTLIGGAGTDSLFGDEGDDSLNGGQGNDTLDGGTGNDTLDGGVGNDTYLFNLGSGKDVISSTDTAIGKIDVLRLGAGITAQNLLVSTVRQFSVEGDLSLSVRGTSDSVRIDRFFASDATAGHQIEKIIFDDGTVWGIADIKAKAIVPTDGDDLLQGHSTSDLLTGLGGNDEIYGLAGNDSIDGGAGLDILNGGAGDDLISGGTQSDNLFGDAGNDSLLGLDGDDLLYGGDGSDLVEGGAGSDTLSGGDQFLRVSGTDTLNGGAGNDLLLGTGGNDVYLFGKGGGSDRIIGYQTNPGELDVLRFTSEVLPADVQVRRVWDPLLYGGGYWLELTIVSTGDRIRTDTFFEGDGLGPYRAFQQVQFSDGTMWDVPTLAVKAGLVQGIGTPEDDSLIGTPGVDHQYGLAGADTLVGLEGDDRLDGGVGADVLDGGRGNDSLDGGAGNDVYLFGRGDGWDALAEAAPDASTDKLNVLRFKAGIGQADVTLERAGAFDLVVRIADGDDSVTAYDFFRDEDPANAHNPLQRIEFADGSSWRIADILRRLAPTGSAPTVTNPLADRTVVGGVALSFALPAGSFTDPDVGDTLTHNATLSDGTALPSWLTFNATTRTFSGTPPTTALGTIPVRVTARDGSGLSVFDDFDLTVCVRNKTLVGTAGADLLAGDAGNDSLTGAAGNDTLTGAAGNDTLDGGIGDDSLAGGTGDDVYVVDAIGDAVVEGPDEGTDLIRSSVRFTVTTDVENLTLTGTASIDATGNSLVNSLIGNSGANRLDGGAGADSMTGGAGDDTYVVDNVGDTTVEAANGGTDTVEASVSWTLGAALENLTLAGSASINGSGNSLANTLRGNSGDNLLDGGAGNDTMLGGIGNDTFIVNVATDVVIEAADEGMDTVQSAVTLTLAANLENLLLTGTAAINGTGNALNNALTGNAGANRLDGGAGADAMSGGTGNDVYVVDNIADMITESAGGGADLVEASVSWVLAADVEKLTLTGTAAIDATGNALANTLVGNVGANRLDGGAGADAMAGGVGDDTYVVDNNGDTTVEAAGGGIDTVESSITRILGVELENLTLTGAAAINATGNALANRLRGNAGANVLNGGAGSDSMMGGAGNDSYVVDSAADVVVESANEGVDLVTSAVNWVLGDYLENLALSGNLAINGTGNALDNLLTGNGGNNTLTGGAGNDTLNGSAGTDTLLGGLGNDIYVVANATDVVIENANEGSDTVQSSVSYTLSAEIENLLLTGTAALSGTGNALGNQLTGNAGANKLSGGAGADTMAGAAGNDTYVVDDAADVIVENMGEGVDLVQSSVSFTLATDLENLTLTGTAATAAMGNALNNVLTGNAAANTLTGAAGNDTLNGGAGNDTMAGGIGDDMFVVNVATDVVIEAVGEGTDTVQSAIAWTLGANVENLTLTGGGSIRATGNELANALIGNTGANTLTGNAGDDTLDGGAGADTLIGGVGNDTYMIGRGYGADLIQDNDATGGNTDVMQFKTGITMDQIWFRKVGNDLEVSIIGSTDKATVQNWYLGNQYHVEQFKSSDGKTLLDSQVQSLVSAMAGFAPPAAGMGTLPPNYQTTLLPTIAASWG